MSTAPEPVPLSTMPTLINVPSFSVAPGPPARSDSGCIGYGSLRAEASVAHTLQPPSFLDDEDDEPNLEDFFDPKPANA
ncbi:hypothetical protein B0H13DRAFT_2319934 [Mycena leptocephala]|nr:hypothetical protein B0H13DRAFT_2319934 [Mycena leptocephala]